MSASPEYCPVSMGAEIVAERWNLLIVRELLTGAHRFNDIHRGLPGLSRTLLSQRLRMLHTAGLVEPLPPTDGGPPGYGLTEAGEGLRVVLLALGTWAVRWRFPRPSDEQLNPGLLLWRMRSKLVHDRMPNRRIVIEFAFESAHTERGWLIADSANSSVCARDPLFGVDVYASATSTLWHEVWHGHRSLPEAVRHGEIALSGERELTAGFAGWFGLGEFTREVAAANAQP